VIDAQRAFENEPEWNSPATEAWLTQQNALIALAESRGWPVARVLHHSRYHFDPTGPGVAPLAGVTLADDKPNFIKHVHSALDADGLGAWLAKHRVARLVVSGIRTDQCCETTARAARDAGYEVDFVLDATLSFTVTTDDGETITAAEIYRHTAAMLHRRFATVHTVEALAAAGESPAVNRHCPRSGKPVSPEALTQYRGETVGFCNPGCRDDFDSDPAARPADRRYFDRLLALRAGEP
ncbi:MAG: isochorismatase family protein, partial [Pseudomonadota bacterium]